MENVNTSMTEQELAASNEINSVDQNNEIAAQEQSVEPASQMQSVDANKVTPIKDEPVNKDMVIMSKDYKEVEEGEPKPDWLLTRMESPYDTRELMDIYGVDGFSDFKSVEDYWKDPNLKKQFVDKFGFSAKLQFTENYNNAKQEFANYQLSRFSRGSTAYELATDDLSKLNITATFERMNKVGAVMEGFEWGAHTRDARQSAKFIRFRDQTTEEYSPELLKSLESEKGFDGLAYSDSIAASSPYSSEEDSYYDVVFDGMVTNADQSTHRVNDGSTVSRLDLETGSPFDGWFNNNKMASTPWDYAKLFVRGVNNMWYDIMNTVIMVPKMAITGVYGIAGMFTDDDPDVLDNGLYKMLTSMEVRNKGHKASTTTADMAAGFFGSPYVFLSTVFDVALQVGFGAALGRAGRGIGAIVSKKATPEVAIAAQQAWAKNTVRTTLTAFAAKDSYNEALDNGFSENEAVLITGATVFALWKATALSDYMVGEYEPKALRNTIRKILKKEQVEFLKTTFKTIDDAAVSEVAANTEKSILSMKTMSSAMNKVFKPFKNLAEAMPASYQRILYEAKQEGLEEMSEELYQDFVKQGATAYGSIMQKMTGEKQGGYMSIFEEGYFKDAAERYATSGVAGAIGGPIGMIGQRFDLSTLTDANSVVDIITSGNKADLLTVLRDMKTNGELGPDKLSTEYNEELKIFEPILNGVEGVTSLSDMVYNTYLYDIAAIDTFISKGMFGAARQRLEEDSDLKTYVESNAMRKDFGKLMAEMMDIHKRTGISMAIYPEMDAMSEEDLVTYMPPDVKARLDKGNEEIEAIQKRIDERKTIAAKKAAQPDVEVPETTLKEPIVDPKDKEDEVTLERLKKEVETSSKVTSRDLNDLLSVYRKVRAIGNGVATEHYVMQHNIYANDIFGSMKKRREEFKHLGKNAFSDQLMAMRTRALNDKKLHVLKKEQALETEDALMAITDTSDASIKEFIDAVRRAPHDVFTAQAYTKIIEYFASNQEKITVPLAEKYDPESANSIFIGEDGNLDEQILVDRFLEILKTSDSNTGIEEIVDVMNYITRDGAAVAKEYFRELAMDPLNMYVPVYSPDPDAGYGAVLTEDSGRRAYEMISTLASGTEVAAPIENLPPLIAGLQRINARANDNIAAGKFFNPNIRYQRNIRSAFKYSTGINKSGQYELGSTELIDAAASAGNMFLSNRLPGDIYFQTDSTDVDNILEQIEIKTAVTKELTKYIDDGLRGNNILASLRKNVLDILNFTYDSGSTPDSRVENHSYKDYTEVTDFFVDFIGDPIKLLEIREKLAKNEALNSEERAIYTVLNLNTMLINTTHTEAADPDVEGSTDRIFVDILDIPALHTYLESKYSSLAGSRDVVRALKDMMGKTIEVPGNVVVGGDPTKTITLNGEGITQLRVAEWVLKGIKKKIAAATDITTSTPYIQEKERDVNDTYEVLTDFIGTPGLEAINDYAYDNIPELKAVTQSTTTAEKGKVNILIEKMIFDVYNGNIHLDSADSSTQTLAAVIDSYIQSAFLAAQKDRTNSTPSLKVKIPTILIGAISVDYTTTFYPKFKAYIQKSTDADPVVLAAQEHAAKYAASYIYSRKFKERVDTLIGSVYKTKYNYNRNILAVLGTAGSGKSTAVTRLGMRLGMDILKDMGYTNTTVIPVSNNTDQVNILYKSLGDMSDGKNGLLIDELHTLLLNADSGDTEAIEALQKAAVILIDEITYVESLDPDPREVGRSLSTLTQITNLIEKFNITNASEGKSLSVIVMGDPMQSGAFSKTERTYKNSALQPNQIMALNYMSHSFRNRNSFLVDSLKLLVPQANNPPIQPGIKYGTSNGKYYGVNLIDGTTDINDNKFNDILNDATLIDNIKTNIEKVEAINAAKAEGEEKESFTVMIISSEAEWDSMSNKMKELALKHPANFNIRPYVGIGGSEANYIIGELPAVPYGPQESVLSPYLSALRRDLNTVASRAFDYAYIINRNKDIEMAPNSESKNMGEGQVMIPDNTISALSKQKVREIYLEILSDIDENAVAKAEGGTTDGSGGLVVYRGSNNPGPGTPPDSGSGSGSGSSTPPGPGKKRSARKKTTVNNPTTQPGAKKTNSYKKYLDEDIIATGVIDLLNEAPGNREIMEEYIFEYGKMFTPDGVDQEKLDSILVDNKEILEKLNKIITTFIPKSVEVDILNNEVKAFFDYLYTIVTNDIAFYSSTNKTSQVMSDMIHNLEGLISQPSMSAPLINAYQDKDGTGKKTYEALTNLMMSTAENATSNYTTKYKSNKFNRGLLPFLDALVAYKIENDRADAAEDLDVDEILEDELFVKFSEWAQKLTEVEIDEVIAKIKNLSSGVSFSTTSVDALFTAYTTADQHTMIATELLRLSIDAKRIIIARDLMKTNIDGESDFAKLQEYKQILEISADHTAPAEILKGIELMRIRLENDEFDAERRKDVKNALANINIIWNKLFGRRYGNSSGVKEEWKINKSDKNEVSFLPKILPDIIFYNKKEMESGGRVILKDHHKITSLFNFDDSGENLADGLELRATKTITEIANGNNGFKLQEFINIFLVAVQGNNKYIVANINNSLNKSDRDPLLSESYRISDDLIAQVKEMFDKDAKLSVIDFPIDGRPGKNIYIRSGGIKNPQTKSVGKVVDGVTVTEKMPVGNQIDTTIAQLAVQGVNFSSTLYVDTSKDDDQSGEGYLLYSWNNSIILGTDAHNSEIKRGVFNKDTKATILDNTGNVSSELGRIPIKFRPPLHELKRALSTSPGLKFAQFPSYFSMALQNHISKEILSAYPTLEGGNIDFDNAVPFEYYTRLLETIDENGNNGVVDEASKETVPSNKILYNKAKSMADGYAAYLTNKSNDERISILEGVDLDYKKMLDANEAHKKATGFDVLGTLVTAFRHHNINQKKPGAANETDIIVESKIGSGIYSFNLNNLLNKSEEMLRNIDVLFSATSSTLRIPVVKGSDNGIYGIADASVVKSFKDSLFLSRVIGIAPPGIVLSSEGLSEVYLALKGKSGQATNKILSMSQEEVEMRDSIMDDSFMEKYLDNAEKQTIINYQGSLNKLKVKLTLASLLTAEDKIKFDDILSRIDQLLVNKPSKISTFVKDAFSNRLYTDEQMDKMVAVKIASNLYSIAEETEEGDFKDELLDMINIVVTVADIKGEETTEEDIKNEVAATYNENDEVEGRLLTELINACKI